MPLQIGKQIRIFNNVEQFLNTDHRDFFSAIVANPAGVDETHAPQLKAMVDLYPQSGILRAMLARASQVYDQGGFQQKLKSAAVYSPDRAILYNLINYPEKLAAYNKPEPEVIEEELLFEDYDYGNQEVFEEGQVYEEEPVNYFHDPEAIFQNPEDSYHTDNLVSQDGINNEPAFVYDYNTHEYPRVDEQVIATNDVNTHEYPRVDEQVVVADYANTHEYPRVDEQTTATDDVNTHEYPRADEQVVVADDVNTHEYPRADEQTIATDYNYAPPFQKEEVSAQLEVVPYDVGEPIEQEEESIQAGPSSYDEHATSVVEQQEDERLVVNGYTFTRTFEDEGSFEEPEAAEPAGYTTYNPDYEDAMDDVPEIAQFEPSGYNPTLDFTGVPEPSLPPIPGYHPYNYQVEVVKASIAASSVIDDEVFDEIMGIDDIFASKPGTAAAPVQDVYVETSSQNDGELSAYAAYTETAPANLSEPQPIAVEPEAEPVIEEEYTPINSEEPELVNDEVDFVMVGEPVKPAALIPVISEPFTPNFDDARVSRYNDDKMPYSFLWWLAKTRKEHAETYQPYVAFKPIISEVPRPAPVSDELQQQYFENIFHITSVEQLDFSTRDKQKEGEIIDRFIQKDPQLKPPNTEKLDNENKAKKSAEDDNELVSVTLAKIYTDQMLYPKAISTYQKLMLKFPEKSSYFVAQIKLLEKKIN